MGRSSSLLRSSTSVVSLIDMNATEGQQSRVILALQPSRTTSVVLGVRRSWLCVQRTVSRITYTVVAECVNSTASPCGSRKYLSATYLSWRSGSMRKHTACVRIPSTIKGQRVVLVARPRSLRPTETGAKELQCDFTLFTPRT